MLTRIPAGSVRMLPGLFRRRMDLNEAYLMELDSGCLLQNFYLEAGITLPGMQSISDPNAVKLHWGWEAPSCQLRGHFLGHWLSAASALCAGGDKPQLRAKLDFIVDELARCQQLNGGEWIGSIPEKYFALMRPGRYIWSPQYTMHKTIMGLKDVYDRLHHTTAIDILDHLADWYVRWVDEMQSECPEAVFSGEQAGMLEVWADLYALTHKDKYRKLMEAYEGNALFSRLDKDCDALSDDHANASIPVSHGAGRLYEITGDEHWMKRMESFWKTAVTDRGMFATTGSNAGEFWIPPHAHARYLTGTDQEFCTVYNMVRTAEYLYRWTGSTEYADYIERAVYNGFLAQQNRNTGMPTYFLPMAAGSKKTWGSRTRDFWCCFGTMVQAQAMYPDLVWYTDENSVTAAQYFPSEARLSLACGNITVSQSVHMKNYDNQVLFDEHGGGNTSRWSLRFTVNSGADTPWTLRLRVPGWCAGTPQVLLNGDPVPPLMADGYIVISRVWSEDIVDVFFPSEIRFEPLEGAPELKAIVDGPIVLAGLIDRDCGLSGDLSRPETILLPETPHTYDLYVWLQNTYRTRFQPENFRIIPLYEVTDEPYTIYFTARG